MDSATAFESLQRQIDTILVLLERPAVRLQVVVLLTTLLLSWLITLLINRRLDIRPDRLEGSAFWKAFYTFLHTTPFTIISLLALQAVIFYFGFRDLPHKILQDAQPLVLLVLGYEIILALLYFRFPDHIVKLYHKLVMRPLIIALVLFLVLNNFLNLKLIGEVSLFNVFGVNFTIGVLARVLAIVYTFGVASYLIQDAFKRRMADQATQSAGVTSLLIVFRYAVIGAGLVLLAAAVGVNAATLAVIGGGLSIGIGFGLQQIAANLISGILLLFEQSLRPGDVIDLDGHLGIVRRVNIRSTTIQTNDNIEIIVPNERFLTQEVTTYTRDSTLIRVPIHFGISYGSDPKKARDLVIETAGKHGQVKKNPEPEVQFLGFGDSSLDFRLLVWMDNPIRTPRFKSDLYFMIWETFAKNDIEIPFPQRDLHLRSGWDAVQDAEEGE